MSKWQPIETAPRDGTEVLACIVGFAPSLVRWLSHNGKSMWSVDPETFMDEDHFHEYFMGTSYDPTHWQPLPPPPQE